ncbi:MAG: metallophosphoesterase family protein [Verrucomicrobiota bacterium]
MKIAVISDTHDKLPEHCLDLLKKSHVDEIWHLGDVTKQNIVDDLMTLEKPLKGVRGNCDWDSSWPMTLSEQVDGLRFMLVHIPPANCPSHFDALLHGHTHVPRDEIINDVRFLNPGTVGKPNKGAPPSLAILETKNGSFTWDLLLL